MIWVKTPLLKVVFFIGKKDDLYCAVLTKILGCANIMIL